MIEIIKEKLGDRLIYIEQEKYDNEYVDSCIFEVRHKGDEHFVNIYRNKFWTCSIFNDYLFYGRSLEELLDKLFDELDNTDD